MIESGDVHTDIVVQIISAYVSNNSLPSSELPALIVTIHKAVSQLKSAPTALAIKEKPTPAVPIKKSITPDYLICLEDGRKFKSLKRYLRTTYNLTPEEYRARWDLPTNYPMVAPEYAITRSILAKKTGLGRRYRRESSK